MTRDRSSPSPRTSALAAPSRPAATPWRVAQTLVAGVVRRPGTVLATVAVLGGTSAFVWNTLMGQSGRHPAPLFPRKPEIVQVEPPRRPEAAMLPLPSRAEAATGVAQPTETASIRPAANDPIGSLIRASSGPSAPSAPKPSADPKQADVRPAGDARSASSRVLAAQRALAKLGYGNIAQDGIIGASTSQALGKFERDRKLPVTGALGPQTARRLAAASGLRIE